MPASNRLRAAFSLVELVLAMAVSGILVGAMGVVLITASSSLERGDSALDGDRLASQALADLQADLSEATRFFERTEYAVWFEVPDRDGDGAAEHIRYAWSGVRGDPLTRSTNGGPPGIVAADVRDLNLTYAIRAGPQSTVSAERIIAGFTTHAGSSSTSTVITSANRAAQILRPSFAGDVVSWKATKLQMRLRWSGAADATFLISLVPLNADNTPGTTPYTTLEVKENQLGAAFRTDEFLLPDCQPIPAGQPVAIVIHGLAGTTAACDLGLLASATPTMPFNIWMATSTNGGASWQGHGQSQNFVFQLYGTVTSVSR